MRGNATCNSKEEEEEDFKYAVLYFHAKPVLQVSQCCVVVHVQGTEDTEVVGPVPGDAAIALHAAAKLVQRLTSSQRIMQVSSLQTNLLTTFYKPLSHLLSTARIHPTIDDIRSIHCQEFHQNLGFTVPERLCYNSARP